MKKIVIGIIFALLIVLSSYIVTAPIWYGSGNDAGLVGKWSCEGNFLDSSGQGNHGTQSGGVTITSGFKGRGCKFAGGDDWINITEFAIGNNFTISTWINPTTTTNGQAIVAKNENIFIIGIYSDGYHVRIRELTYQAGTVTTGWQHIVVIGKQHNSTATNVTVYKDSTILWQQVINKLIGNPLTGPPWSIGQEFDGASTSDHFTGTIDEVRIYNRSLSTTEISALYNTSKTAYFTLKTTPVLGGMNDTPAPTITEESGLVGYWKLDGDAIDSSSQGNDGQIEDLNESNTDGTTPPESISGRWNGGYIFDGVDDRIRTTNDILTQSYIRANGTTISAWIKTNSTSLGSIAGRNSGSSCIYFCIGGIHSNSNGNAFMTVFNGSAYKYATSITKINDNRWHHVVGIYNSSDYIQIYVDGNQENTTFTGGLYAVSSKGIIIGHYDNSTNRIRENFFKGEIDEVKYYNRSLSADEIKELYLSKGLVGHWKMDASVSNITATRDSSGYDKHSTIYNGALLTNNGRFKEGYNFEKYTNDVICAGTSTIYDFGNSSFSVSSWFKPKNIISNYFVSKWLTATDRWVLYTNSAGKYAGWIEINDAPINVIGPSAVQDEWVHVIMVRNREISQFELYVNGVRYNVSDSLGALNNSASNLCLGGASSAGAFSVNGTVDEVRIYNRALSASEIAALYNGTKTNYFVLKTDPVLGLTDETPAPTDSDETGLVGYWKMDDLTNGNTTDSSGQENNGSVIGATFSTGRWDKGYSFDGSNDYISITQNNVLNMPLAGNFSFSVWTKLLDAGTYQRIINKGNVIAGTPGIGWESLLTDNDALYFAINNKTGGTYTQINVPYYTSCNGGSCYNQWTHIAGVWNGNVLNLYVNGVSYGTSSAITGFYNYSNAVNMFIGRRSSDITQFVNGSIDEVRIYNRTLSADEVKELYLSKGLVGHWKMDSGTGSNSATATDSSGYDNTGTVTGATFTNEGRFKEAYHFSTDSPYIRLLNTNVLNSTGNKTISAWIKPRICSEPVGTQCRVYSGSSGNGLLSMFQSQVNQKIYCEMKNSTGSYKQATTLSALEENKWRFATCTYNYSSICMWLDGQLEQCTAVGTVPSPAAGSYFYIGTHDGSNAYNFNGTIDEVRVYNRALSSTEISQLYNGTKTNYFTLKTVAG